MDETLERLAREAGKDPANEAAARRLDRALLRGGRTDDVRDRFRFKYQCPNRWDDLAPTGSTAVKFCEHCRRDVFAVRTVEALREHVNAGHCVAFPSSHLEHAFTEVARDGRLHSAKELRSPCVVPGGTIPDGVGSLRSLVDRGTCEAHHFAPVAVREDKVLVAVTARDAVDLDFIRRTLEREIETVLVTEEELARLQATLPARSSSFAMDTMGFVVPEPAPRTPEEHLARGDFAAAAKLYAEAIETKPEDLQLHLARARALALAGGGLNATLARRALARAAEVAPEFPYTPIWIAVLFGEQAGLTPIARGRDWPAPIARAVLGELDATSLFVLASETPDPGVRLERLCEAHGYLGILADSRDLWEAARHRYRACTEQQVRGFVEHQFAEARLRAGGRAPWRTP